METRPPDFPTMWLPTPPRIVELDRLGDEIAELSAHLEAATASLLATMISRSQTKTGRKREWWLRLRAMQKSYRVIERANAFVCVQANIARQQTNPTGIILAPLLEERRIKRRILSGQVHFVDDCRGCDMIGSCG